MSVKFISTFATIYMIWVILFFFSATGCLHCTVWSGSSMQWLWTSQTRVPGTLLHRSSATDLGRSLKQSCDDLHFRFFRVSVKQEVIISYEARKLFYCRIEVSSPIIIIIIFKTQKLVYFTKFHNNLLLLITANHYLFFIIKLLFWNTWDYIHLAQFNYQYNQLKFFLKYVQ